MHQASTLLAVSNSGSMRCCHCKSKLNRERKRGTDANCQQAAHSKPGMSLESCTASLLLELRVCVRAVVVLIV